MASATDSTLDPPEPLAALPRHGPAIGTRVDRYVVVSHLGSGGMADVYTAQHASLGSMHALKVLRAAQPAIEARLVQEGRVQATLRHANIVAVTDMLMSAWGVVLVMEYVHGPTLEAFLRLHLPTLPLVDLLAHQILRAVAAAHDHGTVHRDLKPGNVLLKMQDGRLHAKVTDFGLAKAMGSDAVMRRDAPQTRSGVMMGTPAYMAPEQFRDASGVDRRADIYAAGAVLYHLACGKPPHPLELDLISTFDRATTRGYAPPQELRPELPARMIRALEAALSPDAADRPASCHELLKLWRGEDVGAYAPVGEPDWDRAIATATALAPNHRRPAPATTGPPTPPQVATPAAPTYADPPSTSGDRRAPAPPAEPVRNALVAIGALTLIGLGGYGAYAALRDTVGDEVDAVMEDVVDDVVHDLEPAAAPAPPPEAPEAPPAPAVDSPEPVPASGASPAPTGPTVHVRIDGATSGYLVDVRGRHRPLTGVPAGRYLLSVYFDPSDEDAGEAVEVGILDLEPGAELHVQCDAEFRICNW